MSSPLPLIVPNWPLSARVHAFSTTRAGGCSPPPYASLNPALHVQDDPRKVAHNRHLIESLLPAKPLWLQQQHTTELLYFPDYCNALDSWPAPIADAVWTDRLQQPCVVMTADCMPILLAEAKGAWVAAVHAGWKGLVDGIVEKTLEHICTLKNTDYAAVSAWIGPAISQVHFEVGEEVRAQFVERYAFAENYFVPSSAPKYLADLNAIATRIMYDLGVGEVVQSGLCTYAEPQRFYSYRYACHHPETVQQTGLTGRIATLIWLE